MSSLLLFLELFNDFVGTRGPRKTKIAMTIIRSLGGSTSNSRSGFARREGGKGQNISCKPEWREWHSRRKSRYLKEDYCESLLTTSTLNDWQQLY